MNMKLRPAGAHRSWLLKYSITKTPEYLAKYLEVSGEIITEVRASIVNELNGSATRHHGSSNPWKDFQFYCLVERVRAMRAAQQIADPDKVNRRDENKNLPKSLEAIIALFALREGNKQLEESTAMSMYQRGKKEALSIVPPGLSVDPVLGVDTEPTDQTGLLYCNHLDMLWEEYLVTGRGMQLAVYIVAGGEIDSNVRLAIIRVLRQEYAQSKNNNDPVGDIDFYLRIKMDRAVDPLFELWSGLDAKQKPFREYYEKYSRQGLKARSAKRKYQRGRDAFRKVFEKA
jgi:hypothetical protein